MRLPLLECCRTPIARRARQSCGVRNRRSVPGRDRVVSAAISTLTVMFDKRLPACAHASSEPSLYRMPHQIGWNKEVITVAAVGGLSGAIVHLYGGFRGRLDLRSPSSSENKIATPVDQRDLRGPTSATSDHRNPEHRTRNVRRGSAERRSDPRTPSVEHHFPADGFRPS